jgi:hypothetical protein
MELGLEPYGIQAKVTSPDSGTSPRMTTGALSLVMPS